MTVLFIGGAHQGKAVLVRALYPALPLVENLHHRVREELAAGRDPMALLEEWRALLGVDVLPDWEETQTVQAGATELRSVQGRLRLQVCAAHETFLLEAASFS